MAIIRLNERRKLSILKSINNYPLGTGNRRKICFFSGDIPTTSELAEKTVWEDIADMENRNPNTGQDTNVQSNDPTFLWGGIAITQIENNSIKISCNFSQAQNSGTVSWFGIYPGTNFSTASLPNYQNASSHQPFIWGTVGLSEQDLIIPTTSIVTGKNYKVTGLFFDIPLEY